MTPSDGVPNGSGYLTRLNKVRYLGSHPSVSGQADKLSVVFLTDRVEVRDLAGKPLVTLPWAEVTDLHAHDAETIEERVTAARVLVLGAFAFVGRKNRTVGYLEIVDPAGVWLFAVPGISRVELHAGLQPLRKYWDRQPEAVSAPGSEARSVKERLEELAELVDVGLVSPEEALERRAAILAEL